MKVLHFLNNLYIFIMFILFSDFESPETALRMH